MKNREKNWDRTLCCVNAKLWRIRRLSHGWMEKYWANQIILFSVENGIYINSVRRIQ